MRILYTIQDLHIGGACKYILNNTKTLHPEHEVYVVYFNSNNQMVLQFNELGIHPVLFKYNGYRDLLSCAYRVRKFIKKNRIEVVHSNLFFDRLIVTCATLGLKVKKIASIHGAVFNRNHLTTLKRKVYHFTSNLIYNHFYDKLIAVSEAAKDSAVLLGVNKDKIRVNYSGVEVGDKFAPKIRMGSNNKVVLGTVGRFDQVKGYSRLLDTFKALISRDDNFQLIFIGDGECNSHLHEKVIRLGLENQVLFKGFITNPINEMRQFDFFINSSYSESLGLSIIESIATGTPAICSKVGGIPEYIVDYENGKLIDFNQMNSSNEIFNFILWSKQGNNYNILSENSIRTFNNYFSNEKSTKKLLSLYK